MRKKLIYVKSLTLFLSFFSKIRTKILTKIWRNTEKYLILHNENDKDNRGRDSAKGK